MALQTSLLLNLYIAPVLAHPAKLQNLSNFRGTLLPPKEP